MTNLQDKTGEVSIHGGIVHCPGGHRTWTVEVLSDRIWIFCTRCKRYYKTIIDANGSIVGFQNYSEKKT